MREGKKMDRKEVLAKFDDDTLIQAAAMRMLDVLGTDSASLHLMSELCERRGIDPYSTAVEDLQIAADVQLDILACFGRVIGMISEGNIPDLPDIF